MTKEMKKVLLILLTAVFVAVAGCEQKPAALHGGGSHGHAATAVPARGQPTSAIIDRKFDSELPPDGKPLFTFLLQKIPALVDKVPCSCCPYTIGQCYRGACPPTCAPCNAIGRDAYSWHKQGLSDDEIIERVKAKKYGAHDAHLPSGTK